MKSTVASPRSPTPPQRSRSRSPPAIRGRGRGRGRARGFGRRRAPSTSPPPQLSRSPCISLSSDDVVANALQVSDGDPNESSYSSTDVRTFQVFPQGSAKGGPLLVDSCGYKFCVKRQRGTTTEWRCSLRTQATRCLATVIQKPGNFELRGQHVHPPVHGIDVMATVKTHVRQQAGANVFEPATNIVDRVLENVDPSRPLAALPSVTNLARAANYHRRCRRPADPTRLDFVLDTTAIPHDFLIEDVTVNSNRHLIFGTTAMLQLLGKAKEWYMDGTFKVVKQPFQQLFTIHTFVQCDKAVKQIPLIYILMSARRKRDYRAVLRAIVNKLPATLAVKTVISDFELALWKSVKSVLSSHVKQRGCAFHWAQAVWRKLSQLGLTAAYRQHDSTHRFCRRIMSLPFLRTADIYTAFDTLKRRATSDRLLQLVRYVDAQWISHTVWPPSTWSVYRRAVRTNNDVESWHARLNRKAESANLALYKLITLLFKESKAVSVSLTLLSNGKVQRITRKAQRHIQARLETLWAEYDAGTKSPDELLWACALTYAPA